MNHDDARKIDFMIAEKIMGFPAEWSHDNPYGKRVSTAIGEVDIAETPHYTEFESAAFSAVYELQKYGYFLSLIYKTGCFVDDLSLFGWEAIFRGGKGLNCVAVAEWPAVAICKAALLVSEYLEVAP